MKILNNFDLTNYNSYRIKSKCNRAIFFDTEEEIKEYYQKNSKIDKILLGSGHNIILSKEYYTEDFIIFNGNFSEITVTVNSVVEAQAGITMLEISEIALEKELSGVEIFYDIPS